MPKRAASQRKERVTVTLSPNSVAFVRKYWCDSTLHVSTALERMIEDFRRTRELEQLNADVAALYDALPDPIVQEQAAWGAVWCSPGLCRKCLSLRTEAVRNWGRWRPSEFSAVCSSNT